VATDAPLMGEPLPVELMNTVWADRDGVHDSLGDRAAAYAWLESVAPRIDIDTASLTRAAAAGSGRDQDAALLLRRLRDSLRRLAADATADDRAAAASPVADVSSAVGEVNEVLRSAASWPVLVADGNGGWTRRVESARGPLPAAVGSIASEAIDLFAGPLRGELRACRAPGCVLYFVRHHPRREWCSAACGNRARVARHYQRHAGSRGSGIAPSP